MFFRENRLLHTALTAAAMLPLAVILTVSCTEKEPEDISLKAHKVEVLEFLPAPGQFVNAGYEAVDMDGACSYALSQLEQNAYVSLGSFGGRIVVRFDHTIKNDGGYDFGIAGNQTPSSSEPGIVYVSRDINGNGLADDPWYEIKGSLYDDPDTRHGYSVTYFRNSAPEPGNIRFRTSDGREGYLPHLSFHPQEYYPMWVTEDEYTLSGTYLKPRNYDQSGEGTMWINPSYGSGYVDNDDPDNTYDGYVLFSIGDAVKPGGTPAHLDGIDFIKVQTGVLTVSGWLGEASTEVCGFMDYNMLSNAGMIQ